MLDQTTNISSWNRPDRRYFSTLLLLPSVIFVLLLSPSVTDGHVRLTFPPARTPDLDFLDNTRTQANCGVNKPPSESENNSSMWKCTLCKVKLRAESIETHIYSNHLLDPTVNGGLIKKSGSGLAVFTCGQCTFVGECFDSIGMHCIQTSHLPAAVTRGVDYDRYMSSLFQILDEIVALPTTSPLSSPTPTNSSEYVPPLEEEEEFPQDSPFQTTTTTKTSVSSPTGLQQQATTTTAEASLQQQQQQQQQQQFGTTRHNSPTASNENHHNNNNVHEQQQLYEESSHGVIEWSQLNEAMDNEEEDGWDDEEDEDVDVDDTQGTIHLLVQDDFIDYETSPHQTTTTTTTDTPSSAAMNANAPEEFLTSDMSQTGITNTRTAPHPPTNTMTVMMPQPIPAAQQHHLGSSSSSQHHSFSSPNLLSYDGQPLQPGEIPLTTLHQPSMKTVALLQQQQQPQQQEQWGGPPTKLKASKKSAGTGGKGPGGKKTDGNNNNEGGVGAAGAKATPVKKARREFIKTADGRKVYPCSFCDKQLPTNTAVKNHERSHTGERPFSCMLCHKSYVHSTSLKSHMKLHENSTTSTAPNTNFTPTAVSNNPSSLTTSDNIAAVDSNPSIMPQLTVQSQNGYDLTHQQQQQSNDGGKMMNYNQQYSENVHPTTIVGSDTGGTQQQISNNSSNPAAASVTQTTQMMIVRPSADSQQSETNSFNNDASMTLPATSEQSGSAPPASEMVEPSEENDENPMPVAEPNHGGESNAELQPPTSSVNNNNTDCAAIPSVTEVLSVNHPNNKQSSSPVTVSQRLFSSHLRRPSTNNVGSESGSSSSSAKQAPSAGQEVICSDPICPRRKAEPGHTHPASSGSAGAVKKQGGTSAGGARFKRSPTFFMVLFTKFGISITPHDLISLQGKNWLNDNVINFYLNLVVEQENLRPERSERKVYLFNSFFYSRLAKDRTKGVESWATWRELQSTAQVLIPINHLKHWYLIVIDNTVREIRCIDSMDGDRTDVMANVQKYYSWLKESSDGSPLPSDWSLVVHQGNTKQQDKDNCGVFMLKNAQTFLRNEPLEYDSSLGTEFRKTIRESIMNQKLKD